MGDHVYLSTRNIYSPVDKSRPTPKKLLPKFIGPYKIVQKISDVAYKLELPSKFKIHPVFHVFLLPPPPPTVQKVYNRTKNHPILKGCRSLKKKNKKKNTP